MARYQLTSMPSVVFDTESSAFVPDGSSQWAQYQEWLAAGGVCDPVPPITFAEAVADYEAGVQAWMDGVAGQNGYASVVSCASYANSSNAQWKADAAAIIAWRDALWEAAYNLWAGYAGAIPNPQPTLAQVIASLPQPEQFGWVVHTPGASAAAQAAAKASL